MVATSARFQRVLSRVAIIFSVSSQSRLVYGGGASVNSQTDGTDGRDEDVPHSSVTDRLVDHRQAFLVLRLVLDRHARLRYGEVLDADAIRQGRFTSPVELADVVKLWLDQQSTSHLWPDVD